MDAQAGARAGVQAGSRTDASGPRRDRGTAGWAAQVRGLGVLLANGLCTRCTQPVFGPV